ncbi:MAG TPA: glycosyltransferase family 9 protein [Verrucomicrobiae bacterium]
MNPRKNILVIRFKAIGDVVLTLPAVHVLRANFPAARITFLTVSENAPLLQGFHEIDEVIAVDRAALKNPRRAAPEFLRLVRRLWTGSFALAVDLQGYGETAWLTRLSGARQRWGTVYGHGRRWAYTRGLTRNDEMHPADWNLQLLRECGLKVGKIKNQFHLPVDALEAAKQIFAEKQFNIKKPTLFIQPFTSSPHKNWPLANYLQVARHWQSRGVQVIFGGGPEDVDALSSAIGNEFAIVAGAPLLVTGGLMQLSTLVLGGDTGMLHLAIAQGKRALMLVHNLLPGRPILYQRPEWVMSAPRLNHLETITVESVIAETAKVLETSGCPPS